MGLGAVLAFGTEMATEHTVTEKEKEIIGNVHMEFVAMQMQELLQHVTEKCFERCVSRPGAQLERSELDCLARCQDRYMEAFEIVYLTYSRLSEQVRRTDPSSPAVSVSLPQTCGSH